MSTGDSDQSEPRPLRLVFDRGTVVVEGLAGGGRGGPAGGEVRPSDAAFRAEAIWYRPIVEHLRSRRSPMPTTPGPTSRPPGRSGSARRRSRTRPKGWTPGGRPAAEASSSCRPGPARRTWRTWPSRRPGGRRWSSRPTIDLMNQWYDELTLSFGVEIGLLGGGYYDIQPITVTTYDSAYMNMERLGDRFGLIVFDECHHLPGPTYGLAATCSIAPFRLGLTATPERADNAHTHLDQLIGPIVYRREITQLRGEYLADYRVERLSSTDRRGAAPLRDAPRELPGVRPATGHRHAPARRLEPVPLPGASARPKAGRPSSPTASSGRWPWPRRRSSICWPACSTATTATAS